MEKCKTRAGYQKPVKHSACQKFKKQPAIKYAFWSECSSLWSISPIWPAKYFYLPTVSSSEGVRSSCLDSRCSQRSQGPPAVSACGPAHSSQKSLLPSDFLVKKRNGGKPGEYCYCVNPLHHSECLKRLIPSIT